MKERSAEEKLRVDAFGGRSCTNVTQQSCNALEMFLAVSSSSEGSRAKDPEGPPDKSPAAEERPCEDEIHAHAFGERSCANV